MLKINMDKLDHKGKLVEKGSGVVPKTFKAKRPHHESKMSTVKVPKFKTQENLTTKQYSVTAMGWESDSKHLGGWESVFGFCLQELHMSRILQ